MKAITIKYKNKPIYVTNIIELKSSLEYAKLQKTCEDNLNELIETYNDTISNLQEQINELEIVNKRLEKIEKELAYNRGEDEFKGVE